MLSVIRQLFSAKLPPLVGAMESRDRAGFEMWGSDISFFSLRRIGQRSGERRRARDAV
jgi:hypothetical protein